METIAICDCKLKKVITIDYNGRVRGFFKGLPTVGFPFLLDQGRNQFFPGACTTWGSNFIISDTSKEYLKVISPYGKFVGILRLDNREYLRDIAALCVDSKGYIWTGHFHQGTISVIKPNFYKNDFDQSHSHDELISLIGRHRTETSESYLT